ncbi:outer membrane beta-barrel protein [Photobacterium sp. BZF1]|uniref:outer membrane beta-barrel protein n=1 Tax=Photobacterium sp. BZF1 TaxID=1904457 RepID=UPI001653991F|nr:outer membrane beta-barrel protein [Photobacterium sp. BZF1]MBC7003055.1 outer membrane beta-barrel protein [Photobacterium sp. BZF1]
MKSRIALLLATLLSTSAFANSVEGPYVGLKLGFTDYTKTTLTVQYGLTAGYTYSIAPKYSIDIEFNATELGDSVFFEGFRNTYYTTYNYSGLLKPKYHFLSFDNQPAYVAAILGVSRIEESRRYHVGGGEYQKDRDHDTTAIYGFETGREITLNLKSVAYFNYQKANMFGESNYYASFGIGVNYQF